MTRFLVSSVLTFISVNAFALSFITEEDVQETLNAQKVIEVSKYAFEDFIESPACERAYSSKSGRAYVVKLEKKTSLFMTENNLKGLRECAEL